MNSSIYSLLSHHVISQAFWLFYNYCDKDFHFMFYFNKTLIIFKYFILNTINSNMVNTLLTLLRMNHQLITLFISSKISCIYKNNLHVGSILISGLFAFCPQLLASHSSPLGTNHQISELACCLASLPAIRMECRSWPSLLTAQ